MGRQKKVQPTETPEVQEGPAVRVVEPEDDTPANNPPEPVPYVPPGQPPAQVEGKKVSKADAVRHALKEGKDNPTEGCQFILDTYGIQIEPPMFSSYKSQIRAKEAQGGGSEPAKRGRKPGSGAGGGVVHVPAAKPGRSSGGGLGEAADIVVSLKNLLRVHGYDDVKKILDALAD